MATASNHFGRRGRMKPNPRASPVASVPQLRAEFGGDILSPRTPGRLRGHRRARAGSRGGGSARSGDSSGLSAPDPPSDGEILYRCDVTASLQSGKEEEEEEESIQLPPLIHLTLKHGCFSTSFFFLLLLLFFCSPLSKRNLGDFISPV